MYRGWQYTPPIDVIVTVLTVNVRDYFLSSAAGRINHDTALMDASGFQTFPQRTATLRGPTLNGTINIDLGHVQKTLLIPLTN